MLTDMGGKYELHYNLVFEITFFYNTIMDICVKYAAKIVQHNIIHKPAGLALLPAADFFIAVALRTVT